MRATFLLLLAGLMSAGGAAQMIAAVDVETFELAPPDKPFQVYSRNEFRRKK